MSKYPINLIEADFIHKRLNCTELSKKYGIAVPTLFYYSKKREWVKKRKKFDGQVIEKTMKKGLNEAVKEEKTLIEKLEYLLELKLHCESKVFESEVEQFKETGKVNNKDLMYLLNKSKDPVGELTKIIELLKGNATDRVEIDKKEKDTRYHRLKEFMTTG